MAIKDNEVEEWVTSLLNNLIHMLCQSMNVKPDKLPDYVEAEMVYDGVSARIRVDFNTADEDETENQVQDFLDEQR